jgi:hypothetical protein
MNGAELPGNRTRRDELDGTRGTPHEDQVGGAELPSPRGPVPASEIDRWIQGYVPRIVPRAVWDSDLRGFVVPLLLELRWSGLHAAYHAAWALTHISARCLQEGLPLEREVVLDPDTLERFLSFGPGCQSRTAKQLMRTTLRRVGPRLTSRAPWEPRPEALGRHRLALPYSAEELEAIARDARNQATAFRRRAARALLALGAGAGLDGRWAGKVRGTDVIQSPEAVLVRVGPPSPRLVPVLARSEAELLDLAAMAGDELLVGPRSPHRNRLSYTRYRIESSQGTPTLSLSRLRTTWLVHHLTVGTRLPELTRAAGVHWLSHPSELLAHVLPLASDVAATMLRGEA